MAVDVSGADSRRGRSVVSKAVSLLDAFAIGEEELSLNELARRTRLPLSTTYRLANELVLWGGLERGDGGGYRVGLRLLEIGARAPRSSGLLEIVVPFMQDLFVATRENVHLAVVEGHEALYIERVTGLQSIAVKSRRWGRMPLHATGVGKVLLAYADSDFVDQVIAEGLARFTAYTIVAPGHLRRNLAEIRHTGVGGGAAVRRGYPGGGRPVDRGADDGGLAAAGAGGAHGGAGRVPAAARAGLPHGVRAAGRKPESRTAGGPLASVAWTLSGTAWWWLVEVSAA
jgi:DNA-binding IclR family transcriptional regulator